MQVMASMTSSQIVSGTTIHAKMGHGGVEPPPVKREMVSPHQTVRIS